MVSIQFPVLFTTHKAPEYTHIHTLQVDHLSNSFPTNQLFEIYEQCPFHRDIEETVDAVRQVKIKLSSISPEQEIEETQWFGVNIF